MPVPERGDFGLALAQAVSIEELDQRVEDQQRLAAAIDVRAPADDVVRCDLGAHHSPPQPTRVDSPRSVSRNSLRAIDIRCTSLAPS